MPQQLSLQQKIMADELNQATSPTTTEATQERPATAETTTEVQNPEGLLSALEKYKKLGSTEQIERALTAAKQFEALSGAVTAEGFDVSTLPNVIRTIKEEEEQRRQLKERFDAERQIRENEFQQQLAEANKKASDLASRLTDKEQADEILPYFNANAVPDAVEEWKDYWPKIKEFVTFETDPMTGQQRVKEVLGPDRKPMWINKPNEPDVKPGTVADLFNGIIEGKYGYTLKAAMKPVSAATGGGAVNPGNGASGGPVTITRGTDYGKLSPEQIKQIKQGNYRKL